MQKANTRMNNYGVPKNLENVANIQDKSLTESEVGKWKFCLSRVLAEMRKIKSKRINGFF